MKEVRWWIVQLDSTSVTAFVLFQSSRQSHVQNSLVNRNRVASLPKSTGALCCTLYENFVFSHGYLERGRHHLPHFTACSRQRMRIVDFYFGSGERVSKYEWRYDSPYESTTSSRLTIIRGSSSKPNMTRPRKQLDCGKNK